MDTHQIKNQPLIKAIKVNLNQTLIDLIDNAELWEADFSIKRNDYLKLPGTTDTKMYHIINGSMRIFIMDDKEEHTIRFGYKNSVLTSLDSFLTGKTSPLCIQAIKKTTVRAVQKEKLYQLLNSSRENTRLWQKLLETLIQQQMEREIDLLTTSTEERLNRVLQRSPQLFQEIPHKYIASYLRMSPETLSRIKNLD